MTLRTVVATYCPEVEEMQCRVRQMSAPYLEFMKSLSAQGVLREVFDLDDYEVIVRGNLDETKAYLKERLTPEVLVIHNRKLFIDSARLVFNLGGKALKDIEQRVDEMFYEIFPWQCHGLYTPIRHESQDIKRKDKLHTILKRLGIDTPRIFNDLDEVDYPCVVKKATGSRSKEVYLVKNPIEVIPFIGKSEYVLQEYVPSIVGYPLQIRAVTFADQFLGAFLSYNPTAKLSVYENMNTFNIPLGQYFMGNALLGEAGEIFDRYDIDGSEVVDEFRDDVERIGQYCADHGTLLLAMDILISHKPNGRNRFMVCDINKDPAPASYLPLIDLNAIDRYISGTHIAPVRAMAEINSIAAFGYFKKQTT